MDLNSLIDRFLLALKIRGFSDNTISGYANDLKDFAIFLDGRAISEKTLIEYRDSLTKKHYSDSTFNRRLSSLRSFLKYLVKEGVIDVDWTVLKNRRTKRKLPDYVSEDIIEKAIGNGRDGLIVRLMYASGLRISELLNLRVSDILFSEGFIRVKGKGSKERVVPVDDKTLRLLREYLRREGQRGSRDFVFLSNRRKPFTRQGMWKLIKRQFRKLGVDLKPHTLRHMFATHMLENGANIRAVQEMLGHESITTTQIYTEITDNSLKEAFEKFDTIK